MSEPRVRLIQALCPSRHCIFGTAYEGDSEGANPQKMADFRTHAHHMVTPEPEGGGYDPWCAICKAPISRWTYEDSVTAWRTLEEATPELKAEEARQVLAANLIPRGMLHQDG